MLLFNGVNLLESIQQFAGPDWHLFVFGGTVPADINSVPFNVDNEELLVQNSISVLRLTSAILTAPYALDFVQTASMLGNWNLNPAWERSEPKVDGSAINRVGIKSIQTTIPNVTFSTKLDLMCGRVATTLNVASPNNTLVFNLATATDLSHISVNCSAGTSYTVFANGAEGRVSVFTGNGVSNRQPVNVAVTNVTSIELVIANSAAAVVTSVIPYTQESFTTTPVTPTWAVLKPLTYNASYLPEGSTLPSFILSAGGPMSSEAVKLNKDSVKAGDLASVMYLRVKPDTMEI